MIYDCFTYCGEIELLKIRLTELEHLVDRFVIVEAGYTFQGDWRGFSNIHAQGALYPWMHKIKVVEVPEQLPTNPWKAEYYVRNQIVRGLTRAEPDDLVIISDVDEIPRPSVVRKLAPVSGDRLLLELREFYYYLDYEVKQRINWIKPVVMCAEELIEGHITPSQARLIGENPKHDRINDAGWHFSCMGGVDALRLKLASFAHSELNTKEMTDPLYLAECLRTGKDFVEDRFTCEQVPIDETFPLLVQAEHKISLAHLMRPRGTE